MSVSRPPNLDAPLTLAEVKELLAFAPDFVRVDEDGNYIPLETRREIFQLQLQYPSLDPRNAAPPTKTGDPAQDILRNRYPSMFRAPAKP